MSSSLRRGSLNHRESIQWRMGQLVPRSASIPSTPVSPQKQSVKFDDQVGKLQDGDRREEEERIQAHFEIWILSSEGCSW